MYSIFFYKKEKEKERRVYSVKEGFAEAEAAAQRPPLWSWSGHDETAPRLSEKGATVNRTALFIYFHVV
jgi:hypothetical protein